MSEWNVANSQAVEIFTKISKLQHFKWKTVNEVEAKYALEF